MDPERARRGFASADMRECVPTGTARVLLDYDRPDGSGRHRPLGRSAGERGCRAAHDRVWRAPRIDLYADDRLGVRILSDLAGRLFAAGYHFGATETAAQLIEQFPPNTRPVIDFVSPEPEPRGPLGELD